MQLKAADIRGISTVSLEIKEVINKKTITTVKAYAVDVSHSPADKTPTSRANPAHAHVWITEEYTSGKVFDRLRAALAFIADRNPWPIPPPQAVNYVADAADPIGSADDNGVDPDEFAHEIISEEKPVIQAQSGSSLTDGD